MMYVNETLQSQIEDAQLEDSECFGYYYDPRARECKHCDFNKNTLLYLTPENPLD